MNNNIFVLLTIMFHLYQTTAHFCYGFFPAAVTLSFLPVGDAPSIPNTNQSINSITCPRTQKDWDDRAYEMCPENKTRYQCLYDRHCRLVEVCKVPQFNYIDIVLFDKTDNTFYNKRLNKIYSNSMDYWMIQYFYCHKHFNTSNPLVIEDGVKTIEKPPWDYYFAWSLVIVLLVILIVIGLVNRHICLSILRSSYQSCLNYCNGSRQEKDNDKKENVPKLESSPPDYHLSSTVDSNGPSLNHSNNEYTSLGVEER
ncbi:uncharacterized protein LOC134688496 [Mytilus trossulus]|uniref:uncharacterized protein LOC134688496 n=1 Tax=Mytilus trossulus TaxID=6551 RepID=UPI003004A0DA